ncbi:acyltransferase family protein [Aquabacterium sp.]|uniref:acyltransferase family protein n=1 Tax=Aquabacterium sp. TaxID=1872578 RepID=UPI003D6D70D8
MKLSALAHGKDNNFNLIRISAALAVLVTHSFVLVTGDPAIEPMRKLIGMSIGDIAVDIFFIASGFLVSASLFKRGNLVEFFISRILRIFPALWVMLALTCFGMAAFFTTLPLADFYRAHDTWAYLAKCGTLLGGVLFNLPGVFEENPYPNTVNGSLWSMPFEVRMYVGLAFIWLATKLVAGTNEKNLRRVVVTVFIAAAALLAYKHHQESTGKLAKLLFMFSCGSAFFVLRDSISMNWRNFSLLSIALILSSMHKPAFFYMYCASIGYILFFLAYVPGGFIRHYNQIGDYSYGLYIYAFPIQQSIAALVPGISIGAMIFTSGVVTLVLAMLSWHLLEKRALEWRHGITKFIQHRIGGKHRPSSL